MHAFVIEIAITDEILKFVKLTKVLRILNLPFFTPVPYGGMYFSK